MKQIDGSITSAKGFCASGVACGLKKDGKPDLALIESDTPAVIAGVFTRNVVKGHSLQRTISEIKGGLARAVIINSGNANACIGQQGAEDAAEMAFIVSQELDCPQWQVMTGSTGVIGQPLDMEALRPGIKKACASLANTVDAGHLAEQAILTTDLVAKEAVVQFELDGNKVTVAGMAKGSGMIHPNMATMIGLITTDIGVSKAILQRFLSMVTDKTFNRVSVDGDTSVCDMVLAMANGASGAPEIKELSDPGADQLLKALETVCTQLAKMIVQDGEGATKLIEIKCKGAATREDAYKIVLAVGRSPLVKTAMFGEDANWGRILTAAGYAGVDFNPGKCDIWIGDLMVCQQGKALPFDEDEASSILKNKEISITISLQEGDYSDRLWTCDFSYDYVKINGSYRS